MTRGIVSSASRYSGKVSHPQRDALGSAVPGMSSTPSISSMSQSSWPGRTGANPTPQLPMTTRGDAVPARRREQRVPRDLAVVVRVDVDEAGRDEQAVGVDGALRAGVVESPGAATSVMRRRRPRRRPDGRRRRCRRRPCRRGSRDRAWVPLERGVRRPHLGTTEMCSTMVAIFERTGHTPDHAADVSPHRTGGRHHGAARRAARRRAVAGRAHPPPRREQVDRSRHPHQPRRRRVGPARPQQQDLPARPSRGRARTSGRRLVPRPRLRPARAGRAEPRRSAPPAPRSVSATTRSPCSTRSPIRVPPRTRSGWGRRSRSARRSAPRWWRGRPTPSATTGSPTCPRDTSPLRRCPRGHPRPRLRGGDRGHARRTRPRAREHAGRRHIGRAPRSTASPTSSPPTRSSSRSTSTLTASTRSTW